MKGQNKPVVLSVANQKGGVGKTTTAVNLSVALAQNKKRVILVDLDAQSNSSSLFCPKEIEALSSIHSVFQNKKNLSELLQETRIEGLKIVVAHRQLAELEATLAGSPDGFFRLQDSLKTDGIQDEQTGLPFDFIILDCPPNLGLITVNSFISSDFLLIPLQAAKFSMDGLMAILDTLRSIQKRFHASIQVLGALFTMYDHRTVISQAIVDSIKEYIPVFQTRISRSVLVEEAHLTGQTICEYRKKSKTAQDYFHFTKEVIDGIV